MIHIGPLAELSRLQSILVRTSGSQTSHLDVLRLRHGVDSIFLVTNAARQGSYLHQGLGPKKQARRGGAMPALPLKSTSLLLPFPQEAEAASRREHLR